MKTCFQALRAIVALIFVMLMLVAICIWQDARDWWKQKRKGTQ